MRWNILFLLSFISVMLPAESNGGTALFCGNSGPRLPRALRQAKWQVTEQAYLPDPMKAEEFQVIVYNSLKNPDYFTEHDTANVMNYVSSGGIFVFSGAAVGAFRNKDHIITNIKAGAAIVGAEKYSFIKSPAEPTELGLAVFGDLAAKKNPFRKPPAFGIGDLGTAKALFAGKDGLAQLTVNRLGKGAVVFANWSMQNAADYDGMLMKLIGIIADPVQCEKFFPAAASDDTVELRGKRFHLAVASGGDDAARKELLRLLEGVLGTPDFRDTGAADQITVHVGMTEAAKKNGLDYASLPPDGYFMHEDGQGRIFLGGNSQRANMYAVTDFVKRFGGYRKFSDHPLYEIMPKQKYLKLPDKLSVEEKPAIPSYILCGYIYNTSFGRNFRELAQATHAFDQLLPPAKYAESHPEWYSLHQGKRTAGTSGWQICMANPELPRLVKEYADAYFKRRPDRIALPLGLNDGGFDCQCDYCRAQAEKYGNAYAAFYNMAADVVAKSHPGKLTAFISYGRASAFPKNIKLNENILVEVCSQSTPSYMKFPHWGEAGLRHFGLYEYYYTIGNPYVVPQHYPGLFVEKYIRNLDKYPLTTLRIEYYPTSRPLDCARQYIIDEAAWRGPSVDPEELTADYCRSMFGAEAAAPMTKFFLYLEEVYRRSSDIFCPFNYWGLDGSPAQFDPWRKQDIEHLDALLDEALKLVRDPLDAKRLDQLAALYRLIRLYILTERALRDLSEQTSAEAVFAFVREGCIHLSQIEKFTMTPEQDKGVFIKGNAEHFKLRRTVSLRRRLENAADNALSALAGRMRAEGKTAEDICTVFEAEAAKAPVPLCADLILAPVYAMRHPDTPNLIRNPSFEELSPSLAKKIELAGGLTHNGKLHKELQWKNSFGAPGGWYSWHYEHLTNVYRLDGEMAHTGKFSACIGPGGGGNIIFGIRLKKRHRYRLEFYVRRTSENNGKCGEVNLQLFQKNGRPGACELSVPFPASCAGKWEKVSMTFAGPDDSDVTALILFHGPPQKEGEMLWIDDVSVKTVYSPEDAAK